jgi:succinylglutamate desuccinylase
VNDQTLAIILAVLAPGGILAVLLERMRRQNNRDHNTNFQLLKGIDRKVDKIDDRLHDHVTDRSAHS